MFWRTSSNSSQIYACIIRLRYQEEILDVSLMFRGLHVEMLGEGFKIFSVDNLSVRSGHCVSGEKLINR